MKRHRSIIVIVCIAATLMANADEPPATAKAKVPANEPIAAELQLLQGTWEGVQVGDEEGQEITITITGNSLHFYRDKNFWFETAIVLPAGKDPKQLHATIKGSASSQDSSLGEVVRAFFRVEDGTLILATMGDDTEETHESFDATKAHGTRYELRKALPSKKKAKLPKSK